ncbi:FecR domain-containing protein [uncultured Alistipes sp.]|jgi:fe2+-dicitrate sensor, membrane component|uniref:FecR family protein n=1 Tax=uncultured Alistipes sp. TaxID=538949 RepID=UPI0025F3E323|nr:FecR domain-containing protein [uncultured Alistipes sp.]
MSKKTKKIVSDFANNDMPAEVQERFRSWLVDNADDQAVEEQLLAEWNAVKIGTDAAYEALFECLKPETVAEDPAPVQAVSRRQARFGASWRKMAAAVFVCCCLAGLGTIGAHMFLQPENGIYVVTGEDNKGRFILPDGTQVWLNYDSRLYYPESFGETRRVVKLEGEALFNVTKDTTRPFEVQTALMDVEVLGTVFDLKCYEHLDYAEVILISGSIKASCRAQQPMTLCPNDRLVAYRDSKKLVYETVNANNYSKWMFERQKLEEMPLDEIFVNLGHRYNIEFDIAQGVDLAPRLTLSLRNESIEEILEAIALVAPIRYNIGDDGITITRK